MEEIIKQIENGETVLGIEFGSTRIKAVLVGKDNMPVAQGSYTWENKLVDGIWTYDLDEVWKGLSAAYSDLSGDVNKKYGTEIKRIGAIGFSAMMHGYLVFDKNGELLVPFRTWRNTITEEAAGALTEKFGYHIPQRWSIAHLYQAILNKESHVKDISYMTTLAGYVHWKLTGEKVVGIGEASGMFPIDTVKKNYNEKMAGIFNEILEDAGMTYKFEEIMPRVLVAGENGGVLTEEGAKLIDPSGKLSFGIPLCPPEGDAGTGMVATNSISVRTGNISAGTSVFAMVVLEKELKKVYEEIDLVTTPCGDLVGMVHCNNCTSDLNAWVSLFGEALSEFGVKPDINELYGRLYRKALEGDADCGGLMSYNYFSGETITGFNSGRPLFMRAENASFNLANFMRTHLLSSLAALKIGVDIMTGSEGVVIDKMFAHGGLFKTEGVGQKITAAALKTKVFCMETAGEGGAWGMAILASYLINKKDGETLSEYLTDNVFMGNEGKGVECDPKDAEGFDKFIDKYKKALSAEKAAVSDF